MLAGQTNSIHRGRLHHNVAALYGVHAANYLVPLIQVPYLTRTLGVAGWGMVAFAQSFATYLIYIIEYGFGLSATREVARYREDPDRLSRIAANVLGAKIVLTWAAVIVAAGAFTLVGQFRSDARLFWFAVFFGVVQAFQLLWFFQGVEDLRLVAIIDVALKLLATAGIVVWVHGPRDAWLVFAISSAASAVSVAIVGSLCYRRIDFRWPSMSGVLEALRMGWSLFVFRSSVSLYTVGNTFILGLVASPEAVGYFAGAEKICRATLGLLQPLSQAIYPRISGLAKSSMSEARSLAHQSLRAFSLMGGAMGVGLLALAGPAVRLALGGDFARSVLDLQVLALLPPLVAVSNAYGLHWLVPLGRDRDFNRVIIGSGLLNVVLGLSLAPWLADTGMATSVVIAEALVAVGCVVLVRRTETPLAGASRSTSLLEPASRSGRLRVQPDDSPA